MVPGRAMRRPEHPYRYRSCRGAAARTGVRRGGAYRESMSERSELRFAAPTGAAPSAVARPDRRLFPSPFWPLKKGTPYVRRQRRRLIPPPIYPPCLFPDRVPGQALSQKGTFDRPSRLKRAPSSITKHACLFSPLPVLLPLEKGLRTRTIASVRSMERGESLEGRRRAEAPCGTHRPYMIGARCSDPRATTQPQPTKKAGAPSKGSARFLHGYGVFKPA